MPDRYGFNHLGDDVRCVVEGCEIGGPLTKWPVRLRDAHYRMHQREIERAAKQAARQRQREATARLREVARLRKEARQA
jgi:hypothetical protein